MHHLAKGFNEGVQGIDLVAHLLFYAKWASFGMRTLKSRDKAKLLRNHIRLLCSFHRIKAICYHKGEALIEDRIIQIRPVKSERTYAEALHELGHILGPWQKASEIAAECGAWIWARKNALQWTAQMESRMAYCLGTYVDYANNNDDSELPSEGHPAWKTLNAAAVRPKKKKSRGQNSSKTSGTNKRKSK